ncbi:MAG TPA: BTAD domain-containing putative transcriptional regulator [Pseudonocardiaceae bacterium]|nr:BTAD domain-containing putative transcriptional regulator [Pseudonocardiaceae bacterium]
MERLRVELLGPMRARLGAREIDLGSIKRRALFAMLAMRGKQVVARDEIIDGLWANTPPTNAAASVYTYVNGLRRALEPGRDGRSYGNLLRSVPPGYLLDVDTDLVDATRFTARLDAARASMTTDPAAAVTEFDAALALWRAAPLDNIPGPFAHNIRLQLLELRAGGIEDRATTLLNLGKPEQALTGLDELIAEYPSRERPRGLSMLALHRTGHRDAALAVFADFGSAMAGFGVETSPALRGLHDRIARDDPTLREGRLRQGQLSLTTHTSTDGPARTPAGKAGDDHFVGRKAELTRLRTLLGLAEGSVRPAGLIIGVVSGGAGVGKTALALRLADEAAERFPDGQLFLDLHGVDRSLPPLRPEDAIREALAALGLPTEESNEDNLVELTARYRTALAGRRLLIVLDNAVSSDQVRPLLPGTRSCLVLVTSRNRLTGLVARDGAQLVDLGPFQSHESIALLSQAVGHDRAAGAAGELAKLAHQCANLPLALTIAAERITAQPRFGLAKLVAALADQHTRLDLLCSPGDRSRSVREALSWSYLPLEPSAAHTFRLLALAPSREFSFRAVAALRGEDPAGTHRLLDSFATAHLVEWAGRDRYRLPDLSRWYAAELAAREDSPIERTCAVRRLLRWYLHTVLACDRAIGAAEDAMPASTPPLASAERPSWLAAEDSFDRAAALNWLTVEEANLQAVQHQAAKLGEWEYLWQLADALTALSGRTYQPAAVSLQPFR